ncbi:LysR family transcriptional regulator [Actinomycetota bacterium]
MDVRHLLLLRELAARGSVTAVATATHRTPSAVSQQLRSAERELGVTLTQPDGRGIRLTAAGRLLAERADDVSRALASVQADLDDLRETPSGTVTLGALPSAAEILLPPLLVRLRETDIDVAFDDFDIAESEYAARTLDHDIVLAHSLSGPRPLGAEGLSVTPLAREPVDIALPSAHPLAAKETLRPTDLAGARWIAVPEGYPFETLRLAVDHAAGGGGDVAMRLRDNDVVAALVASGEGVALLPRFTTRPREGMVLRPLRGVRASRHIVALSRPDRAERAAVRHVVRELRAIGRGLAS